MARERPTASNVSPVLTGLSSGTPATDAPRFARAQVQARRRTPQMRARPREYLALLPASDAQWVNGAHDHADAGGVECIHTVYRTATGNWANEAGSGQRVYGVHATKQESVRQGRDIARAAHCPHVIHNEDGTISSIDAPDG